MTTSDGFSLPLPVGMLVCMEVHEARWPDEDSVPVVVTRLIPGRVASDGETAIFDGPLGLEHKHLAVCRVARTVIHV